MEMVENIEEEIILTNKGVPDIEVAKKMINLKQSADSRNIKFDLSFLTLKKLMEQRKCFYTSINFESKGDLALSIDRMDNKLGYIEGNVVACTVEMNRKKADITLEEIEMIYKAIKKVKKISPEKED
jgi:hypothetical protein